PLACMFWNSPSAADSAPLGLFACKQSLPPPSISTTLTGPWLTPFWYWLGIELPPPASVVPLMELSRYDSPAPRAPAARAFSSIARVSPWVSAMNDSPITRTSLAATVPVSQVMEPVVLVSVEVSLVVPPVLEAPPAPVLLVVEPVVSELLLAVFPPKPVVPVVVTVAVVVPPVVDALDVVELTAPKPVVVAVLVEDTVLVVAVVLLLVLSMVAVEPVDSFSGSVPSLPSLLQAAPRAQSARAVPPRSRRVAFEGRCGRYAVTVWPRSRLAST